MTFRFNRLRDKGGVAIKHPEGVAGVTLDIDKSRRAYVFSGETIVGELYVMEFEAHAKGLFLRGYEPIRNGDDKVQYQEWFLAYEEPHESKQR